MKIFASLLFVLTLSINVSAEQNCAAWPQWNTFKHHFISPEGRVIDLGSQYDITTSEGQSYALFSHCLLMTKQALISYSSGPKCSFLRVT